MTKFSYTSSTSSPVSVPVADWITCAVVRSPVEWKGRVRFPRWSSIDDVRRTDVSTTHRSGTEDVAGGPAPTNKERSKEDHWRNDNWYCSECKLKK
ncbi:hypothetical protein L5515_013475 [Caenorhabditis briggsae]|uniref:Uncharacterized protein n=1 Tax=Caenorhabditis briggsae TaxID=6238 RepID=A0AAE9J5G9_CAEBR|nr:hypothetical protein L5515_013475 [Caenorhabditis briggsae]